MQDGIALRGWWNLLVRNPDGSLSLAKEGENLVVVDGFELAAALIADESVTAPSHMAAGDGTAEPEEGQSDLEGTEQARTTITTSRTDHIITYTANFSSLSSDVDVSEFGIFNDASAGTMLARFITEQFTLIAGQSMDITWEIRVGR